MLLKFTNPDGKIEISADINPYGLLISVKDNGVGISKDNIDKLFRIEESCTTLGTQNESGTGLGLLLCNEFVLKHGGKIWAESELSKGSTFSFIIPKRHS
jgi:signal transduction histidine kinase